MDYAIQASQLKKTYGKAPQPAIAELDLAVAPGQIYGLIGPDGAGKTTTLRILSTVMEQSDGLAHIHGFNTRHQAEQARPLIGYMPQAFSLYPDLSVMENLRFFADLNRVPSQRREARIAQLLRFARLERFTERRSSKLSGGMRKKLALACALIHDPKVLLLDEPTTGVDPVSRRELWVILAEVVQEGVTILISTPYMDEAERCHQVAVLHQGKILADGRPSDLKDNLPFRIVEVKARPRKQMRQIADATPGVQSWRPVGDTLRLAVAKDDIAPVIERLQQAFDQETMQAEILKEAAPSMEDVFVHMVRQERNPA